MKSALRESQMNELNQVWKHNHPQTKQTRGVQGEQDVMREIQGEEPFVDAINPNHRKTNEKIMYGCRTHKKK
jgi:hypothetical protein